MTPTSTYDSTVNSFYLAFYGRPADPAGLAFWSQQLAGANGDLHAISAAFSTSEEAATRFASESAGARIADIYQSLFNRAPDAAGLAYWLDAIENGHATMANVAIEILKGAQGTDHTLADLRQQAMDSFTAQVKASGTEYTGYASVEAARVLVRAVTLETSGADLDALVKAAVSFADTATKTPAVVNAIATGSTLLAMYDTARGLGDPVALTQALADTAKAAAGNPVTLDSLLRGGGMAQVLKVMPAAATLQDVVDALATGGLPAAVEVVYPTAPVAPVTPEAPIVPVVPVVPVVPEAPVTPAAPVAPEAPTFSLQFAFKEVTQGAGDTQVDNVTNVASADVKFSYTGTGLKAGQHVEYSVDGGATWNKDGIVVSAADHSVTITGVDLAQGTAASSGGIQHIRTAIENLPNLLTTISVRAVDAGGGATTPVSQQIVYDHFAATPRIALVNDTAGADFGNGYDMITRDASYTVGRIEAGATVEYLLNDSGTWTKDAPALAEGENVLAVHQIDAAGNVSATALATIIVDTRAPAMPTIALATDSGNGSDAISKVGKVAIAGLDTDIETAWEYSVDGGANWTFGDVNDGSGKAELDLTGKGDGPKDVQVRQYDLAGNVGAVSNHVAFTLDANAPDLAMQFTFVAVSEADGDLHLDNVTNQAISTVGFIHGGDEPTATQHFEYSLDGINWHRDGLVTEPNYKLVAVTGIDLGTGKGAGSAAPADATQNLVTTVYMRVFDDASGEGSAPVSQEIVYDRYVATPTIALDKDTAGDNTGSHTDLLTRDGSFSVGAVEAGAIVEYQVDTVMTATYNPADFPVGATLPPLPAPTIVPGSAWTKDKPVLGEGLNSFTVRQTDAAGNVSETAHVKITVDSQAPSAPSIALANDTGTVGDGITAVGKVTITGLENTAGTGWEYSLDGGKEWTFGDFNNSSGQDVLDLTRFGDGHRKVLVHQVDAAGNVGAASAALEFTLESITGFTVKETESGLEITSGYEGELNLGNGPLMTNNPSGQVVIGTTTVGAQYGTRSGMVTLATAQGESVADGTYKEYVLATDSGNELSGQIVWGFGGDDIINGGPNGDHLYGGAGQDYLYGGTGASWIVGGTEADYVYLGSDNVADTVVIHAGDTARGVFQGDLNGVDVINGAQAGDLIKLDDVFTAMPTIQSTLLTDVSANHVAIVRGTQFFNSFNPDGNGTSYLIQWSDGQTVNTIQLAGYGAAGPMLDIDVQNDTITLVAQADFSSLN